MGKVACRFTDYRV